MTLSFRRHAWLASFLLGFGTLSLAAEGGEEEEDVAARLPAQPPSQEAVPVPAPDTLKAPLGTWLQSAAEAYRRSDPDGTALWVERILQHRATHAPDSAPSAEEQAALMLLGWQAREQGDAMAALDAFRSAAALPGPLTFSATYRQAEAALGVGRHDVVRTACDEVQKRGEATEEASDCHRLLALAAAREGQHEIAREAAGRYDATHRKAPLAEHVELELALAGVSTLPPPLSLEDTPGWAAAHATFGESLAALKALTVHFKQPATYRTALRTLEQLRQAQVADASPPNDLDSQLHRATSLRDAGLATEAWDLYTAVLAAAQEQDPSVAKQAADAFSSFGWRTHRYAETAQHYEALYAQQPSGKLAWLAHRTWLRAGDAERTMHWALRGLNHHPTDRDWRDHWEELGKAAMLAGDTTRATRWLDEVAEGSNTTARRAAYLSAIAAYAGDRRVDAIQRLSAIVDAPRGYTTYERAAARYWRAKARYERDPQDARVAEDHEWVLQHDAANWYGVLIRQDARLLQPDSDATDPAPPTPVWGRTGRWHPSDATVQPDLLSWTSGWVVQQQTTLPVQPALSISTASGLSWGAPWRQTVPGGRFVSPEAAQQHFAAFVEQWGDTWPVLHEVALLSQAGLDELSGPLMASWFEDVRHNGKRDRNVRKLLDDTDTADWRHIFYASRDVYHLSRFSYGLHKYADSPEARTEAWALERPLAYSRHVWPAAAAADVDPTLILGLMRTESTYRADAVSRAGARGPMQIMPRTGALVADLQGRADLVAQDLFVPAVAVTLGVDYLGRLMDRWDGVWPLAVASYNGGPHNVAGWWSMTGPDMPTALFVEHIPFRETRGYVRKVGASWDVLLREVLHAEAGVDLPPLPRHQHADRVDF